MVVAFHYYQRNNEPKHWKDHDDWRSANKSSIDLVLQQLGAGPGAGPGGAASGAGPSGAGPSGAGRYGLGAVRTLEQYQAFAGVDFESKSVSAAAKRGLVSRQQSNGTRAPDPPACYADLVAQPMAPALAPVPIQAAQLGPQALRPLVDTGSRGRALLPQLPKVPDLPSSSALDGRRVGRANSNAGSSSAPLPMGRGKALISTNPSRQPLVKNLFPTPNPRGRRRIDFAGGYLAKDTTGAWHEYKAGQRFATFQQRRGSADDTFVLLYDASRELNLRLDGKGHCQFVQGQLRPDSVWRTLFHGEWQ
jgi:hypothetical protein